jgi:hypothetical protein
VTVRRPVSRGARSARGHPGSGRWRRARMSVVTAPGAAIGLGEALNSSIQTRASHSSLAADLRGCLQPAACGHRAPGECARQQRPGGGRAPRGVAVTDRVIRATAFAVWTVGPPRSRRSKRVPDQDPKLLLTCYAMVGTAGLNRRPLDPQARIGCLDWSEGRRAGSLLPQIRSVRVGVSPGESAGIGSRDWLPGCLGPPSSAPGMPGFRPPLAPLRLVCGSPGRDRALHADQDRRRHHATGDRRPGGRDGHRAGWRLLESPTGRGSSTATRPSPR